VDSGDERDTQNPDGGVACDDHRVQIVETGRFAPAADGTPQYLAVLVFFAPAYSGM
jgi:hypothetical protein